VGRQRGGLLRLRAGTTLNGEESAIPDSPATFDWFTVRRAGAVYGKDANDNDLRGLVGICVSNGTIDPFPPTFDPNQLRIQHEEENPLVLPVLSPFDVCTSSPTMHNPPFRRFAARWHGCGTV
jgi:hypothetical protein